jgi:hypothetical protein
MPPDAAANPKLAEMTNDNSDLKKRILTIEKEIGIQKNKNMELMFSLEQAQKERDNETDIKREILRKIGKVKKSINLENMMNDEEILTRAKLMERCIST